MDPSFKSLVWHEINSYLDSSEWGEEKKKKMIVKLCVKVVFIALLLPWLRSEMRERLQKSLSMFLGSFS